MDRSTRTLVVVAIAVLLASASTYLVYRTIKNRPAQVVEVAETFAVVAAHPIPLGTKLAAGDVKRVAWPTSNRVPGGFVNIEEVVDHGVIAPIAENEPLSASNVASKDAGAGLPATIPQGMRALSVKVNEVIGVAGFVVPGTRVDVMMILKDNTSSLARVVVSNVQVLAAGTKFDQAIGREGQAMQGTSVVTLLVNPEDAERVALAANEGNLLLTLRNPLDTTPTSSSGLRTSNLTSGSSPNTPVEEARPRRVAAAPKPPPPPSEPPPPPKPGIEVIKAGKREIIK